MTDTLIGLFLLLLFVGASFGAGELLLKRVGSWTGIAEQCLFSIALGMGIIAYLVLALGSLRLLAPRAFWVLFPVGALLGGIRIVHALKGRPLPQTKEKLSPVALTCIAVLAGLALLTMTGALAPPGRRDWDALAYHLADPKIYLREGRIFYIPWESHSNFPFTLEMLYTLMLGLGSARAATLCHWLCGVLLVLSVHTFAARYVLPASRGRVTGLLAALIVATTPIVLWESSVAYVDLATALFTWLSVYALFNAAEDPAAWLVVSAVLMGFALGTKATVLGFWGLLLVGILGRRLAIAPGAAALWASVSLLVAAPWYIKSWLYTGNPVYPFFYRVFDGRYWSEANALIYQASQARFGLGKGAADLLLAPWQATMERSLLTPRRPFIFTEYGFGLSPVYVALLLAAPLFVKRLSRLCALLALFGLSFYVFWFFLMQQTRYLIPVLPGLAVVSAEALLAAWEQFRVARWFGAALVAASAGWGLFVGAAEIAAPSLPAVTGQVTMQEYLARWLPGLAQAVGFVNRETPRHARVALFDEVRGFYLDRSYLWATPNHSTLLPWDRYTDVDDWLADFKRRGFTTLIVNARFAPPENDGQRWRGLLRDAIARDRVTLAFQERGVRVYRIP